MIRENLTIFLGPWFPRKQLTKGRRFMTRKDPESKTLSWMFHMKAASSRIMSILESEKLVSLPTGNSWWPQTSEQPTPLPYRTLVYRNLYYEIVRISRNGLFFSPSSLPCIPLTHLFSTPTLYSPNCSSCAVGRRTEGDSAILSLEGRV